MQASQARIRRTPFGEEYDYRPVRANPFDVHTRARSGLRRTPRLSAAKLAQIRIELDRLDVPSEMLFGSRRLAPQGGRAADLYRAILRLSLGLMRLALRGIAAQLLDKTDRIAPVGVALRRRQA